MYHEGLVSDTSLYIEHMLHCYFVAEGIHYLINFLLSLAARLVIGVAASKLCNSIERTLPTVGMENIQITIGPIVLEYKTLKTF